MYPEPNRPARPATTSRTCCGRTTINAFLGRVDHNFSSDNRMFVNGYYNKRREDRYNWALGAANSPDGSINGFPGDAGLRLPQQHGLHGRLDLGAVAARPSSTCG